MNKSIKIAICVSIWIIFSFIFRYITKIYNLNKNEVIVITLIPIIFIALFVIITKYIENKNIKNVKEISENYKLLCELNKKYSFVKLNNKYIYENEYSHKSLDRANASDIVLYHIENNINNIREYILEAYRNKFKYDKYIEEYNNINKRTDTSLINKIGFDENKFYRIEKRILEKEKTSDKVYNISVCVSIKYETKKTRYTKDRVIGYQQLCDLYMQWRNGKKYAETSKRERKYMNDKLRYDVLKRDNFTCQKCGMTAKDGAKLHVDHIIPVSKGGKTTMSNLQTLCDRCNIGKGTKDN